MGTTEAHQKVDDRGTTGAGEKKKAPKPASNRIVEGPTFKGQKEKKRPNHRASAPQARTEEKKEEKRPNKTKGKKKQKPPNS